MESCEKTRLTFRPARADDLEAIVGLLADDKLGAACEDASAPLNPAYKAAFSAIEADGNQLLAVVEQDGADGEREIVGCLQLCFIPSLAKRGSWRGQIESVRIAASQRGQGLGETILDWAIRQCKARGCKAVQLTTDKARPDAMAYYESKGFAASHDGLRLTLD